MADSRLIRPLPKPLQLRDYLMDDMSSCSSNGFKSFPRRSQCCTTVRFLHEFDRKNKHHHKIYLAPPSKPPLSALQTVIAAVKCLQFTAAKSPEKKKLNISFLPRSFSKKILRKTTFWRRKAERKEIVRWKSFDQLLKEDAEPSDRPCSSIATADSKSKTWSDTGNSSSSEINLNLPEKESNDDDVVMMPMEVVSVNGVGVTNGDVSTDSTTCSNQSADSNSKKQWSSEEKEQFSPVSVLDCPFDDEDEVSSPFQHRLDRMEGTKKKLLKKIQMFECLAKLEPVNLSTRFALQPNSDTEEEGEEEKEEDEEEEEKALALLRQAKANMPSYALKLKADKLLLDFFRERIVIEFHEGLIEEAEDWINGRKTRGPFMEWGVQKNRESFVRDMEKGGEWKALDQETEEVALEVENEVFDAMLNEELLYLTI